MSRYLFDIETNGLLDTMDTIHCVVLTDLDTRQRQTFRSDRPRGVLPALDLLSSADEIVGHNIAGFDIPAIQKVFPLWAPRGRVTDTLIISRLIWTELKNLDFDYVKRGKHKLPLNMAGLHSLEAWGHRLKMHKGDYAKVMKERGLDPWAAINDDMVDYCENDVDLNVLLYDRIVEKNYSQESIDLEHQCQAIIERQEKKGCWFNETAAVELLGLLVAERGKLDGDLRKAFGSWYTAVGLHTTKRSMRRRNVVTDHYEQFTEGVQHTKIVLTEFNPASRQHISNRLIKLYKWKPKEFTSTGQPVVDEGVLSNLVFPEAKLLTRYLLVEKRIGQLSEGNEGWLKQVKNGRIHGRVNIMGTVTGRASHFKPNLGQVPRVGSAFGYECRALFGPTPGRMQVGADASGLELRCLAHYMAKWDGGAYANAVINGRSEDETDVHSLNCKAIGFEPKVIYTINGKQVKGRDIAKTFIYAFLYGAGDEKIGSIVGKGRAHGKKLREKFLAAFPALAKLVAAVKSAAKRGYLIGLDGRRILVRSEHAALNTLLQGAGAVIMKKAMVNMHELMSAQGKPCGDGWDQILWVHDEFQNECEEHLAELLGLVMVEAIRKVTQDFNLRCPLDGEFKVGKSWAECH